MPPYTVGGLVRLVLPGEDPNKLDRAVVMARICERDRQIHAKWRSPFDLESVADPLELARRVFGSERPI